MSWFLDKIRKIFALLAVCLVASSFSWAQQTSDLVDRSALRVCADPANMPFSNKDREGFENKIADLIAGQLDIPVTYVWFPQAIGFVRQTLRTKKCDIIMGYASGHELVLNTNPYYRSTYALIYKKDGPLKDLKDLNDERLKAHKIGIIAGTPPSTILALNGLIGNVVPYRLMVDRRFESPAEEMLSKLQSDEIHLAILWGPIGGYYAKKTSDNLAVVPMKRHSVGSRLAYRITFGIRPAELDWKHTLNDLIAKNQVEINKILRDYGVPLLDENGDLLTE